MDEIPVKYEWLVTMEIAQKPVLIQADTADEAMKIAEDTYQLKDMDARFYPELISTSAQIHDVTNKYREKMKILLKSTKERETRDNFQGFLQENPTWSKNKRIEDGAEELYKKQEDKAYKAWHKEQEKDE
jgi:hypothetical protein